MEAGFVLHSPCKARHRSSGRSGSFSMSSWGEFSDSHEKYVVTTIDISRTYTNITRCSRMSGEQAYLVWLGLSHEFPSVQAARCCDGYDAGNANVPACEGRLRRNVVAGRKEDWRRPLLAEDGARSSIHVHLACPQRVPVLQPNARDAIARAIGNSSLAGRTVRPESPTAWTVGPPVAWVHPAPAVTGRPFS